MKDFLSDDGGFWSPRVVPMHHGVPMIEKGWINQRYECETCGYVTYIS